MNTKRTIAFEISLGCSHEETVEAVAAALKSEGFGILTRIDVKETLKKKLNVDFRPYVILGACNPPLAHRALSANPLTGLLLPCNVTVESVQDGSSLVRIADPRAFLAIEGLGEDPSVRQVASEARERLERVALSLKEHS